MPLRTPIATIAASLALAAWTSAGPIDDRLNQNEGYRNGIAALSQNKNVVAAQSLSKVLEDETLAKDERLRVLARIAEAHVRGGRYADALALFDEPGLAADPGAGYWRAVALMRAGRSGEAEKILAAITKQPEHPHWPEATLTRTSLLLRFGAPEEAIEILTPLVESGRQPAATRARMRAAEIRLSQGKWDEVKKLLDGFETAGPPEAQLDYLRARLSLGRKDWAVALSQFQDLNKPEVLSALPPDMRDGAILCLATAQRKSGAMDEAIALLQTFIDEHPDSPNIAIAFDALERLGVFEKPSIDERLANWSNSESKNLASTATYYLAIAQLAAVSEDAAAETLTKVRENFKDQPVAERALLHLSEIYIGRADKQGALGVLAELKALSSSPAVRARVDFFEAKADFAAGEFKEAAEKFEKAASTDQGAAAVASFNGAIASLKAQDLDAYNRRITMLVGEGESATAQSLQLERALYRARQELPGAGEELSKFVDQFPDHPRRAEALLALAYLQLNQGFPVAARQRVKEAREIGSGLLEIAEEADYLSFWIEVGDHKNAAAVEAGQRFVQNNPGSDRAPEVLFKVGGIHFRDGAFNEAQTAFERLALEYPNSPRAEIALFTAGRAAMRTGTDTSTARAIQIFQQVAELGGKFAIAAKLQEAHVYRIKVEEEKAIDILDSILRDKPTGEMLFSTLITKGETLFVLGNKEPEAFGRAIEVFDTIAEHPGVDDYWRNQALTRKGNTLERAGRPDEALAAYEEVVRGPRKPLGEDQAPEHEWYYKAGFAAIRIYEERENWKAAMHTADTLAAMDGPEAPAARERARKLELRNFLWRD